MRTGSGKHAAHREILQRVYGKPPAEVPDHLKAHVIRLEEVMKPRDTTPADAEGHVSRMIRKAIEKFGRAK
jgi:pyruvate/oxaloacetate carboxyltransferase